MSQPSQTTQVVVWSHRLHAHTEQTLQRIYGPITVHEVHYHSEDRNKLEEEIDSILDQLKQAGALDGRVVMAAPSLSSATFLATIGIFRETGVFPDLINLLQASDGRYRPSKEKPVFEGRAFGDRRRKLRVTNCGQPTAP